MTSKKIIGISMVIAGMTAISSQIIFLREFLIVFYGNEISIGIILASWLIWGAAGSLILGYFSDRFKNKIFIFSIAQMALAFILPAVLFAIRLIPKMLGITTGEIIGYYPMMLASFIILGIPCVIMGFIFSLVCSVYEEDEGGAPKHVANVYILEASGALIGGFLVSLILIRVMIPFQILFMLSAINLLSSVFLQKIGKTFALKKMILFLSIVMLVSVLFFTAKGGPQYLQRSSLNKLWSGYNVLRSVDTVYGDLTVTSSGEQRSFYENGLHLYTVPDKLGAEESVHFGLLEAPDPKKVLLIGGGVGGLLEEILKHPVESIDYVELDPMIISLAEEVLDEQDSAYITDPRVNIINTDGRFFVKNTDNTYDCVIISLGDPYTAQINRFYTRGFYREVAKIMNPDAVLSFMLTSSANYISKELEDYLHSIYLSLSAVFPDIKIVPGDTAIFLASNTTGLLTLDHIALTERLKERNIETLYVQDYYLFDKLSQERVDYASAIIEKTDPGVKGNEDFRPVSYFYATAFWGSQFSTPLLRKIFITIKPFHIWMSAIFFCFLCILFVLLSKKRKFERTAAIAVMTTGFAEINFQIAVILSFQIIYGYVFYKIGIIITSFMVGLALGGLWISRQLASMRDDRAMFRKIQVAICIYPLILPVFFYCFSRASSGTAAWVGANIVFPVLPIIAGFIGGVQFPLANKIYLGERRDVGRFAGICYALDLLGACVGSLVAAAFIVPVLGVFQACLLVAVINLVVYILLLAVRR